MGETSLNMKVVISSNLLFLSLIYVTTAFVQIHRSSYVTKHTRPTVHIRYMPNLYYIKNSTDVNIASISPKERFTKTADTIRELEQPCILTIDNVRYNITAWGKSRICFFSTIHHS